MVTLKRRKLFVNLEVSSRCNASCLFCPQIFLSDEQKGLMTVDTFESAKKFFGRKEIDRINFWGWGESTLNKDFPYFVKNIKSNIKIASTNCAALPKWGKEYCRKMVRSGANLIELTLDGYNQKTVSNYRKGLLFDDVVEGCNMVMAARGERSNPKIILRVLMFKYNESRRAWFINFAKKLGVDGLYFGLPILHVNKQFVEDDAAEMLPDNEEYRRYRFTSGKWRNIKGGCPWGRANDFLFITNDGLILPCDFDWNRKNVIGNVFDDRIGDVLKKVHELSECYRDKKFNFCRKCCVSGVQYMHHEIFDNRPKLIGCEGV